MSYKKKIAEKINSGDFSLNEKFKTKKSLGQNFLNNKGILKLITKSADIKGGDFILEIGPGEGALTECLSKEAEKREDVKILCIEKDHRLISVLEEKFQNNLESGGGSKIKILEADILKWGGLDYFKENKINNFNYKIIANIPYYITGAIIEKFLEETIKPSVMILMVQKEVAQRMVENNKSAGKKGKGSILSLCTEYYADVEIIKIVSKGSFTPAPKIDSAVIRLTLKKERLLNKNYLSLEKKYLELVKVGLAHKRKTLISNFKNFDKNISWEKVFSENNLDLKVRGEDLGYENFLNLANFLSAEK